LNEQAESILKIYMIGSEALAIASDEPSTAIHDAGGLGTIVLMVALGLDTAKEQIKPLSYRSNNASPSSETRAWITVTGSSLSSSSGISGICGRTELIQGLPECGVSSRVEGMRNRCALAL
jgi:hypothetical protein